MTTVLFLGSETWSCRWGVHPFASWSCVTISMALGTITKHDSKNYSRLFKIEHLYFYGLTHIFLFVDKSCFVCVGFINHVNDHYRRGCLHIDAGLQTSHTPTYVTSLLWETWRSLCGSGACSGGLNFLCKDYFGHFIIGAFAQKYAEDLDYGRKPTEQSWHQSSEGTSQNKENLFNQLHL